MDKTKIQCVINDLRSSVARLTIERNNGQTYYDAQPAPWKSGANGAQYQDHLNELTETLGGLNGYISVLEAVVL